MEHIFLMEQKMGRSLEKGEVVHHINLNKADNRIENLQLMSIADHVSLHRKLDGLNPTKSSIISKSRKTKLSLQVDS